MGSVEAGGGNASMAAGKVQVARHRRSIRSDGNEFDLASAAPDRGNEIAEFHFTAKPRAWGNGSPVAGNTAGRDHHVSRVRNYQAARSLLHPRCPAAGPDRRSEKGQFYRQPVKGKLLPGGKVNAPGNSRCRSYR